VVPLTALVDRLRSTLDEWWRLRWSELHFPESPGAQLVCAVLLAIPVLVLVGQRYRARGPGRRHLALPALLPAMRRSSTAAGRHIAFLLFLAGVPFFAIALADPHTSFTRDEKSFPGRRIAMLVDASTSMVMQFDAVKLRPRSNPAFFTAIAAAERFMRQRMDGPYHDLVALIQFGNQAYVVTPFTTDYENVILSLNLVSNPREWGRFSDWGTTIIQGLEQGTALFKAFDFVNAAGNLMLVFTDGRDDQMTLRGEHLDTLMLDARRNRIPIYMIRMAWNLKLGEVRQDKIWQPAVERTGGRFYAAPDEAAILRALDEIDRLAVGRIEVRQYTAQEPRFAGYALIAVALWLTAALLKLGVPYFSAFP
jgi:hypothetical protein